MPLALSGIGSDPLSALPAGTAPVQPPAVIERVYFSSKSFVTRATDTPTHTYIPGYVARQVTLGRRITQQSEGQFGSLIEAAHGELELDNSEGQLDDLVRDFRADGRQVKLKIGATEITNFGREQVQAYQLFETVYTTTALDFYHEKSAVRLSLGSLAERLGNRMQQTVYSGAGGVNGTVDMAGRSLPVVLGRVLNVSAQILDPNILSYDLHGGPISTVEKVYDRGIELTFDGDYTTYSVLAAAAVTPGRYATSLGAGKMRLGSPPSGGTVAGTVTVDMRGDIDNSNGTYVGQHGSIMRMVLRDYGGLSNADIDLTSFNDLNAVQTSEMGLFLPAGDQSTVLDVVERIAWSCGAVAGQDRSGLFRVKRLDPPLSTPHWSFDDREILMDSFERVRLPYRIPWKGWGVGYSKNWTVQSANELATGVTAARKTFLEAEYRYKYSNNTAIAQTHLTSRGAPLRDALFLADAGAQTEADRLMAFYSLSRAMYRFVVKTALFSVEIGQTVRITLNRYDLHNGKNFVVVGIYDDADSAETELTVFG